MAAAQADVVQAIQVFVVRVQTPAKRRTLPEDNLEGNPFSSEETPQTVGDLLAFYDSALASDA